MDLIFVIVTLVLCFAECHGNLAVFERPSWQEVFRYKRQTSKRGFTVAEKMRIVDLHNHYRRQEPATNMKRMEWNNQLEAEAQKWADNCEWEHSDSRYDKVPGFRYIGENLYARTDLPDPDTAIKSWADEIKDYTFSSGACRDVCGHYTQVVWAESYAVGCGITFCPVIRSLSWRSGGYMVVCNYGPGGNIIGQRPFRKGQPVCSDCSLDFPYCVEGLCSKNQIIVAPIPSSAMSLHLKIGIGSTIVALLSFIWLS